MRRTAAVSSCSRGGAETGHSYRQEQHTPKLSHTEQLLEAKSRGLTEGLTGEQSFNPVRCGSSVDIQASQGKATSKMYSSAPTGLSPVGFSKKPTKHTVLGAPRSTPATWDFHPFDFSKKPTKHTVLGAPRSPPATNLPEDVARRRKSTGFYTPMRETLSPASFGHQAPAPCHCHGFPQQVEPRAAQSILGPA